MSTGGIAGRTGVVGVGAAGHPARESHSGVIFLFWHLLIKN